MLYIIVKYHANSLNIDSANPKTLKQPSPLHVPFKFTKHFLGVIFVADGAKYFPYVSKK